MLTAYSICCQEFERRMIIYLSRTELWACECPPPPHPEGLNHLAKAPGTSSAEQEPKAGAVGRTGTSEPQLWPPSCQLHRKKSPPDCSYLQGWGVTPSLQHTPLRAAALGDFWRVTTSQGHHDLPAEDRLQHFYSFLLRLYKGVWTHQHISLKAHRKPSSGERNFFFFFSSLIRLFIFQAVNLIKSLPTK